MINHYTKLVGDMAIVIGIISYMPVLLTIYKTKKTNNFPYKSLVFLVMAQILWVIYGYLASANATLISGLLFLLIYLFILYTKYTN